MSQTALTQSQELEIFRLFHEEGETKAALGRQYDVSPRTIGRALDRVGGIGQPMEANEDESDYEDEVVEEAANYSGIMTNGSITVTKSSPDTHDTITLHRGDIRFDEAWKVIMAYGPEESDKAFREVYESSHSIKAKIESFSHGNLLVDVEREKIMFQYSDEVEIEIPESLEGRIFEMLHDGADGEDRLLNFANRLMNNPSHRAVKELYGFLSHNDIDILDNGKFVAFKKVRYTYFDIHSNTMDNSPGRELRVPRNMVDEDSNVTCSYGLHVCARHYLGYFGNGGDNKVIRVEVDPADVVAVPRDYHNAKMRVCGYEVIGDE